MTSVEMRSPSKHVFDDERVTKSSLSALHEAVALTLGRGIPVRIFLGHATRYGRGAWASPWTLIPHALIPTHAEGILCDRQLRPCAEKTKHEPPTSIEHTQGSRPLRKRTQIHECLPHAGHSEVLSLLGISRLPARPRPFDRQRNRSDDREAAELNDPPTTA